LLRHPEEGRAAHAPIWPRDLMSGFQLSALEDWELHGATWRTVEFGDERVVLELCSCSGEPMDRVESYDRELIEYVRDHRKSDL
jgi:hypothetical protein